VVTVLNLVDQSKAQLVEAFTSLLLEDGWKGQKNRFGWIASFCSFNINEFADLDTLYGVVEEAIRIDREPWSMMKKETEMNRLIQNTLFVNNAVASATVTTESSRVPVATATVGTSSNTSCSTDVSSPVTDGDDSSMQSMPLSTPSTGRSGDQNTMDPLLL